MARFNVEADGEWACFSGVVDAFITPFMPLEEYEKWRTSQYGKDKLPIESAFKKTLKEALFALSLNKTNDEIIKNLQECQLMHHKENNYECTGNYLDSQEDEDALNW